MADATTCIRNHWPPFGAAMPRALRSVAMALLDVRAQRLSPRGRLRPIDFGLLWIAELDATGFGGGQRMACALADHVSLMLGSGGPPFGPRRQSCDIDHS